MTAKKSTGIWLLACGLMLSGALALVSWGDKQPQGHFGGDRFATDTIPEKKGTRSEPRNIEEAIEEVENARQELKRTLQTEMGRMQKEMEAHMKEFDAQRIKMEIEKSLKDVDFEKIKKEVKESLDKAEWRDNGEFKKEMEKAEKDLEKARVEFEKAKNIDMKKLEKEMAAAREEIKNIGPRLETELKKAEKELEKAKESLKETKNFIDGLAKAGLIDKEKDYTIEHKDGQLFINGQKQPESVYKQFEGYLKNHKELKIKKELDSFQVNHDRGEGVIRL